MNTTPNNTHTATNTTTNTTRTTTTHDDILVNEGKRTSFVFLHKIKI